MVNDWLNSRIVCFKFLVDVLRFATGFRLSNLYSSSCLWCCRFLHALSRFSFISHCSETRNSLGLVHRKSQAIIIRTTTSSSQTYIFFSGFLFLQRNYRSEIPPLKHQRILIFVHTFRVSRLVFHSAATVKSLIVSSATIWNMT